MPMSLQEQIRLLSMVDILGPLSEEEMEDLAKRTPDTFLDQGDVLYSPRDSTERLFILKQGRVQVYEVDRGGMRSPYRWSRMATSSGRWP
jgi:CRP/FNR family transcriptional regulator, cyclic AMP receptor protein